MRKKDYFERDECVNYCVRSSDNLSINREDGGTVMENLSIKSCNGKNSVVKCQVRYRGGWICASNYFICRRQDWRRAFLRGGNVRREIRGLQPSVAILQHKPKQKSEKVKFGKCGYLYSSLCLKM